ncbi:MAG: nucleotide exchange factor GrpE [Desulfomonile tiedjei]|uniref:Protein GrpE n=1 Tax=Desulfomonile tiedjei TaxID=2358 RepID=A0A9D6V330_9BACT|nr:nucleotide exchange factor GrpE [Desulfomonile tiedjei]
MTDEDRKKSDEPIPEREKAIQQHAPTQLRAAAKSEEHEANATGEAVPAPDPLERALKEAAENRDRWMRAVADLENYKKRSAQEKSRLVKYRNEELLRDLLVITDNLERALSHCNASEKCDPLGEGVAMTLKMFRDILKKHGVTEIQALGETFNPHLHEAIARVPCSENGKPNQVVQELEKGFMYEDRLLRPTKVVVSTEAEN